MKSHKKKPGFYISASLLIIYIVYNLVSVYIKHGVTSFLYSLQSIIVTVLIVLIILAANGTISFIEEDDSNVK